MYVSPLYLAFMLLSILVIVLALQANRVRANANK